MQEPAMINVRRMAVLGRKRLCWGVVTEADESVMGKGHCMVNTADGMRFEVPLTYLRRQSLQSSYWGCPRRSLAFVSNGRIMLPCDSTVTEYAMCLLRRSISREVEKAFLSTMEIFSENAEYYGNVMPLCKPCGTIHRS